MNIAGVDTVYTEKLIKIIYIGAGIPGILLAYKLKQHCAKFLLIVGTV
jgi:cation diffusion facilitator CzcD-associated flavoprotein CzcO